MVPQEVKSMDLIRNSAAKAASPSQIKGVKARLEQLIKQNPGTEAAQEAQKLLAEG